MMNEEQPWQGPLRKAPPINVGERYTPSDVERYPNGVPINKRIKSSRRLLRGLIRKHNSSIERAIMKARRVRLESERLATNSHEAQRYVAAERDERLVIKHWWRTFLAVWRNIGAKYRSLLEFARAK